MDEYYQENPESFKVDIIAQMSLYFETSLKELMCVCDWDDSDEGTEYMAEIIYQLKYGHTVDRIIHTIYKQCVDNDRLNEFNKIKEKIEKKYKDNQKDSNQLVVRPRDMK